MSLRTTPYGTGFISHCSKGGFPSLPPFPGGVRGWRRVTTEINIPMGSSPSEHPSWMSLGGGFSWDILPFSHKSVTLQGPSRPHFPGFLQVERVSHLHSSSQHLPGPQSPPASPHPRRANLQQNNSRKKEEALRAGEEGKVVSKPGHIKRLFPWQPLVPTAAQACFNHLPINSAGVCTPFPQYLHWDGWGHELPEAGNTFEKWC